MQNGVKWTTGAAILVICWAVLLLWLLRNNQEVHSAMSVEQTLRELDEAFAACPVSLYTEPHHAKPADARLSVFRSPKHWVILIEKIDYFIRMHGDVDCFSRAYTLYGNCLENGWAVSFDVLWENETELPFDAETGRWLPTRRHLRYFMNGRWWDVYPTPHDLQQAGIDSELLDEVDREEWQENPDTLMPVEWLRHLCHHLDHPFFASEARLREVVREAVGDTEIASSLQIVLQTREWEHPDYVAGELPSDTESFRVIAEIIATGDASLWARVDRTRFNSHWRYWVEKERAQSGEVNTPLSEGEQHQGVLNLLDETMTWER